MKRLVPLFALLLATSCSHANTTKTDAPKAASTSTAPAAAAAAPKAKAMTDKASCKHGADVRDLAIVSKGGGCAVTYTKHGETKEVASAEHETQHCKEVLTKVRGRLETAGFSCN